MTKIIGVKSVICTCGKEMQRLGGQFGGEITFSTYYCRDCKKGVNVIDLKDYDPYKPNDNEK